MYEDDDTNDEEWERERHADLMARIEAVRSGMANRLEVDLTLFGWSLLNGLDGLEHLKLEEVDATGDLGVLAERTALETLELGVRGERPFEDLTFLRKLKRLRRLHLPGFGGSLQPLAGLRALEELRLGSGWNVKTLKPLGHLSKLRTLHFDVYPLASLTGLEGLDSLEELAATASELIDIEALAELSALRTLSLSSGNPLSLAVLTKLPALRKLDLSYAEELTDLSELADGTPTEELNLGFCASLQSLSGLANSRHLRSLNLDTCRALTDITDLAACTELRSLDLRATGVESLAPLLNLPKLETVTIHGCKALKRESIRDFDRAHPGVLDG